MMRGVTKKNLPVDLCGLGVGGTSGRRFAPGSDVA